MKKNSTNLTHLENVLCLLVDLFGYQNKRSNQNSAQFRQVSACLNLATLHDKTCIISKIFLEKIDLKFSEKGQRNPKKASNDDLLMTYTKGF